MEIQQVAPLAVAELDGTLRRSDDVGEHDSREHPIDLRPAADTREELFDLVEDRVLISDEGKVIRARELYEPRPSDPLGQVAGALDRERAIIGPVDDERRNTDRAEHGSHVDLTVHPRQGQRGAGTRTASQVLGPPGSEAIVVLQARGAGRKPDRATPPALDLVEKCLVLLRRRAERIVVGDETAGVRPDQDERNGPFRKGRREQQAHRPTFRMTEQRCTLHADRVQDGANVVHPFLESGNSAIGLCPRDPSLSVEEDETENDANGEKRA